MGNDNLNWNLLDGIISIDLYNVKPENIQRLLEDNGLYNNPKAKFYVNPKKLIAIKNAGIRRVCIDRVTCQTIAMFSGDPVKVTFDSEFVEKLYNSKSIKFTGSQSAKKEKIKKVDPSTFTIDQILDKINESGVESLTTQEKEFLENTK